MSNIVILMEYSLSGQHRRREMMEAMRMDDPSNEIAKRKGNWGLILKARPAPDDLQ